MASPRSPPRLVAPRRSGEGGLDGLEMARDVARQHAPGDDAHARALAIGLDALALEIGVAERSDERDRPLQLSAEQGDRVRLGRIPKARRALRVQRVRRVQIEGERRVTAQASLDPAALALEAARDVPGLEADGPALGRSA